MGLSGTSFADMPGLLIALFLVVPVFDQVLTPTRRSQAHAGRTDVVYSVKSTYINEHTGAMGFAGASSLQRMGVEQSLYKSHALLQTDPLPCSQKPLIKHAIFFSARRSAPGARRAGPE